MGKKTFLDFESPIAELEAKIEELRYVQTESAVDISDEIDQLSKKSQQLTKDIYSELTPWQITKIARHSERPMTLDYIREVFTGLGGPTAADVRDRVTALRAAGVPIAIVHTSRASTSSTLLSRSSLSPVSPLPK